jgi:hypothetical protein
MGMHFPAESSAEDLDFHRGRVPYAPPGTDTTPVAPAAVARTPAVAPAVAAPANAPNANTSPQR